MRCIISGSISQENFDFSTANKQCMANSLYSIILSTLFPSRKYDNEEDIDMTLYLGNELYKSLRPPGGNFASIYLEYGELPTTVPFQQGQFAIEKIYLSLEEGVTIWQNTDNVDLAVSTLALNLHFAFNPRNSAEYRLPEITDKDGFMFTAHLKTVAFWKSDDKYYIFDPHSVSEERIHQADGKARVFECITLLDLAESLLIGHERDGSTYEILRIQVGNFTDMADDAPSESAIPTESFERLSISSDSIVSTPFKTPTASPAHKKFKTNRTSSPCSSFRVNLDSQFEQSLDGTLKEASDAPPKAPGKPRGRPKKTRGRPRTSGKSKKQISLDSTRKHKEKNPEKVKKSRKKFETQNPEKVAKDKEIYKSKNPDKIQKAHKDYIENNVEQVKKSKKQYTETHPEKVQESKKQYTETHPEQVRKSDKKYVQKNPEKVQESKKQYTETHPEKVQESKKQYTETHPERVSKSHKEHNVVRSIPKNLRKFTCIGDREGKDLDEVGQYELKKPGSLSSPDTFRCPHCSAPLFEEERGREKWCCGAGSLLLPRLPLIDTAEYYDRGEFLSKARAYNNLFAFSAFGTSQHYKGPDSGVSFVTVQGKIYHRIFDLGYENPRGTPNNTAMYIEDNLERQRIAQNQRLDGEIVEKVEQYLASVNPFVGQIRALSREASEDAFLVFEKTNRQTHGNVLGDLPVANEIAALIKFGVPEPRKAVIWKVGGRTPQHINILDACYEPLQYPIIFPHGTQGWYPNLMSLKNVKVTQVKYYRYLVLSEPRFTFLRRLSQEYFVDGWARIEEEKLEFIRNNQDKVIRTRIGTRQEIDETIFGETGRAERVAGRIYLPSSYTQGPRYMQVHYHNAMAMVNRVGQPSYFLTVTCNPRWPEIVSSLNPDGEQPNDRPDLCNRVFKLKLDHLLREIRSGKLFGEIDYMLYVIEFQKRGLPHSHIAFRVKGGGPKSTSEMDKFVRATIPSENEAGGRLRVLVLKHMIHGPCGPAHLRAPCMDEKTKKCTKYFPKAQNNTTYIDGRGYVIYKRPCEETVTITRGRQTTEVSDQDVVPYNAPVLLIMDCHCNLEIATSSGTVKYMMKYVYKGPDRSRVAIRQTPEQIDEINDYVEMRYISASSALWREFEFDVRGCKPPVLALAVHLPNQDLIVYVPGAEIQALERSASKLILYLERPKVEELNNLTYLEFYERYFVEKTVPKTQADKFYQHIRGKFVYARSRGECITRLQFVAPTLGEVFYLRMLLLICPANSFEDLRTVDGITFPTFQEAAEARGLFESENEFTIAMREAVQFKVGRSLRYFFFTLITFGAPAQILWTQFRDYLIDDFLRLNPDNIELAETRALLEIDRMLRTQGHNLRTYGLREVSDDTSEVSREKLRWNKANCSEFFDHWYPLLNSSQRELIDYVLGNIFNSLEKESFYLDGPGGTGKTLVLNVIAAKLRAEGKIVLPCAFTGIAALNYEGGTTAHSMFKLPFIPSEESTCSISFNSERADLIRQADLIIWDEISTVHRCLLHVFNNTLKDLHQNRLPFGGKTIIFAGDFRQIPPIVESNLKDDVCAASVKTSPLWYYLKVFRLTTPQRLVGDILFSEFLLSVGEGRAPQLKVGDESLISLGNIARATTLEDLISFVYPSDILQNSNMCCSRAILSGTNANIREINKLILDRCDGNSIHLYSADKCVSDDVDVAFAPPEVLNSVTHQGVPDHDLELKIGSVCVVMRNICFQNGLVNGTKVIVKRVSRYLMEVEVPGRSNSQDNTVLIPRISFRFQVGRNGMEIERKQFPVKLAYAMTCHKVQGMTLDFVGLDLRSDVFSHGQLYVALSRTRRAENIRLLVPQERVINNQPYTKNIVYKELLQIHGDK